MHHHQTMSFACMNISGSVPFTMDRVGTFLESSTIHGLAYISTTRSYSRFLWTLIVIAGFSVAGLLINESFDAWSESPVKTTIETLPITDLEFPEVTVCPPSYTFTDLNYDLMLAENISLNDNMRNEMLKYAIELIEEDELFNNNLTKLEEDNRYYNWYYGFTDTVIPTFSTSHYENVPSRLIYYIYTSTTAGNKPESKSSLTLNP